MKFLTYVVLGMNLNFAGPNQNAILSVDLFPGTGVSDSTLSFSKDNGPFWVAVRIAQAVGLDSYGFELGYDSTRLTLLQSVSSSLPDGLSNFLESQGGTPIGFVSRLSQWDSTKISLAHSLAGSDSAQSPSGSGILALLRFQPRGVTGDAMFTLGAIQLLDWKLQLDSSIFKSEARLTLTTAVGIRRKNEFHPIGFFSAQSNWILNGRDLLGRGRYYGSSIRIVK